MKINHVKIFLSFYLLCGIYCNAASISGPTTVSPYCPVTYNLVGCGGGTINWSSSPASMEVLAGGNGNTWITVRFLNTGTYGITVFGSCPASLNGITVSGTIPTISGPTVACYNSFSVYTAPAGSYSHVWSVNVAVQSQVASGSTYTIKWLASSPPPNAVVSLTTNTSSSCTNLSLKKSVTIENSTGSISGPSSANSGYTYSYSVSGSNSNWSVSGGTRIDPQGSNPMRIKWNCSTTPGIVAVSYTSNAGCTQSPSMNVTLTPIIPTLTPLDSYPVSEYCYKADRTFVTDLGYPSYTWTITGNEEGYPSNPRTIVTTKLATDPNRHTFNIAPTYLYGAVTIKVKYDLGGGCMSDQKSQTMTITPASIAFRSSSTDVPTVCYQDSQNVGGYSTDAGYTNYTWITGSVANVGSGTATAAAQNTNINWTSAGTGIGGSINVKVTYFNSVLNCTNTNLQRIGVILRKPALFGIDPVQNSVGVPTYFSSSNSDGYEWSWAIDRPTLGRFTDQSGTNTPPNNSATYITWDQNDEPGSHPYVSVNYWIYYPQVGGTRISYCTASKQVDIRACSTCSNRKASDVASNNEEPNEPGIFQAYPMPADNELWLHNVPIGASIRMISMNGTEVISTTQDKESHIKKLETGSLSSGVYLLRTVDIDNQPVSVRVIIRH